MTYSRLAYQFVQDEALRKQFEHAELYLRDVYGMLRFLPPEDGDGGGGNFAASLVLLCVLDGLSRVWPVSAAIKDHEDRFKKLIRCRLHWGPEGKGKWVEKGTAAKQLYVEFRNPLVHELARDKPEVASARSGGLGEPLIGRWGGLPSDLQSIVEVEHLAVWNDDWPILGDAAKPDEFGKPRLKLSVPGLYWAVKRLATELLEESKRAA